MNDCSARNLRLRERGKLLEHALHHFGQVDLRLPGLAVRSGLRHEKREELVDEPDAVTHAIAERLSDKLQIMMVPMDGKNFFATDVMRSAFGNGLGNNNSNVDTSGADDSADPAPVATTAQRKPGRRP